MALTEELNRLHDLHQRGGLSDDEFARAKARLLDEKPGAEPTPAMAAISALRRSTSDRWVAGVCGGIAVATGVESWVWRLIFAALLLWGGVGLLVYLLLWVFVPEN
jgi:phage shock protein PspC (stress-responsive transcriptional regulator)